MAGDPSPESFNPYQAPSSPGRAVTNSPLGDWLARPSPSLSKVRSGVGIIFTANMLILAAIVCAVIGMAIPPALLLMIPLLFFAWIMSMVGQVYCLSAPRESGGRGIIYASTVLMFTGMALSFANNFLLGSLAVGLLANSASVVGNFLFIVFLLQLSKVIGRKSLVTRAKVALGTAILAAVLAASIVAFVLLDPHATLDRKWLLLLGVSVVIFIATYLSLLSDLSQLLRVRRVSTEPAFVWPNASE